MGDPELPSIEEMSGLLPSTSEIFEDTELDRLRALTPALPTNSRRNSMKSIENILNEGGPAYPQGVDSIMSTQTGMTLRDWFAGQALPAMIAASQDWPQQHYSREAVVNECYAHAEAMLRRRVTKK